MAEQKQDDQLEHTFSSYVRIRDVALKTYQRRRTIGRSGERGSGISVPAARHDDDDKLLNYLIWRCLWCNGYRRGKWTRRHEFKSWTRWITFHIALISLGKVWIQLFSPQLWVNSRTDQILQPWWGILSRRRKTLNSNLLNSALKNWPCVISCPSAGVGK